MPETMSNFAQSFEENHPAASGNFAQSFEQPWAKANEEA